MKTSAIGSLEIHPNLSGAFVASTKFDEFISHFL